MSTFTVIEPLFPPWQEGDFSKVLTKGTEYSLVMEKLWVTLVSQPSATSAM
jgi:hypothetical protein